MEKGEVKNENEINDKPVKQHGKLVTLVLKYRKILIQIIKYNFVGVVNTGIDLGLVALLVKVAGLDFLIAKPIAYTVGIVNSFILNKFWTFRKKAQVLKGMEILKFILVNLITLGVSMAVVKLLEIKLGLDATIGNMVIFPVAFIINFTLYKFWIFKNREI